jgi:hypothetical protein
MDVLGRLEVDADHVVPHLERARGSGLLRGSEGFEQAVILCEEGFVESDRAVGVDVVALEQFVERPEAVGQDPVVGLAVIVLQPGETAANQVIGRLFRTPDFLSVGRYPAGIWVERYVRVRLVWHSIPLSGWVWKRL